MKRIFFAIIMLTAAVSAVAQSSSIRVFSHRGGRMEHDENTLEAFQASYDGGYRGYETDVRLTADSAFVITHDSRLERTTDGSGCVEHCTEAQLRALRTKQGHSLLFLPELLDFLDGQEGLYVEFEMKTRPEDIYTPELLEYYCDALYKAVMPRRPADGEFIFTSSDERALTTMQRLHPDADLLLITGDPVCDATIERALALGIPRLGATIDGTSRQAVRSAHERGLAVSLWPGQSIADFLLGVYLGADFLCTDVPLQIRSFQQSTLPNLPAKY